LNQEYCQTLEGNKNRRFGIFPDASGGYTFFILGVDRIWNWYTSVGNWATRGVGFEKSDALWTNIQTNLKSYVTTHEGVASYYSQPNWKTRVDYLGPVKFFLQGKKTLAQLKADLNCL